MSAFARNQTAELRHAQGLRVYFTVRFKFYVNYALYKHCEMSTVVVKWRDDWKAEPP